MQNIGILGLSKCRDDPVGRLNNEDAAPPRLYIMYSFKVKYMSKKVIVIASIIIVIAAGYYVYTTQKTTEPPQDLIYYKDPGIDEEQTKLSKEKLQEYITLYDQLPADSSDVDKGKHVTAIGNAYYGLGMYREALEAYQQASELNPESYSVWVNLFLVENDMGDYKAAHEHIQIATTKSIFRADPWIWLIDFEREVLNKTPEQLNDLYDTAIEAMETTSVEHSDLLVKYAAFLEKNNRLKEAKVMWLRIIEKDPENDVYHQEYERVDELL